MKTLQLPKDEKVADLIVKTIDGVYKIRNNKAFGIMKYLASHLDDYNNEEVRKTDVVNLISSNSTSVEEFVHLTLSVSFLINNMDSARYYSYDIVTCDISDLIPPNPASKFGYIDPIISDEAYSFAVNMIGEGTTFEQDLRYLEEKSTSWETFGMGFYAISGLLVSSSLEQDKSHHDDDDDDD